MYQWCLLMLLCALAGRALAAVDFDSCRDKFKSTNSGEETDVDCGGDCAVDYGFRCGLYKSCLLDSDCLPGLACSSNMCVYTNGAPCVDDVQCGTDFFCSEDGVCKEDIVGECNELTFSGDLNDCFDPSLTVETQKLPCCACLTLRTCGSTVVGADKDNCEQNGGSWICPQDNSTHVAKLVATPPSYFRQFDTGSNEWSTSYATHYKCPAGLAVDDAYDAWTLLEGDGVVCTPCGGDWRVRFAPQRYHEPLRGEIAHCESCGPRAVPEGGERCVTGPFCKAAVGSGSCDLLGDECMWCDTECIAKNADAGCCEQHTSEPQCAADAACGWCANSGDAHCTLSTDKCVEFTTCDSTINAIANLADKRSACVENSACTWCDSKQQCYWRRDPALAEQPSSCDASFALVPSFSLPAAGVYLNGVRTRIPHALDFMIGFQRVVQWKLKRVNAPQDSASSVLRDYLSPYGTAWQLEGFHAYGRSPECNDEYTVHNRVAFAYNIDDDELIEWNSAAYNAGTGVASEDTWWVTASVLRLSVVILDSSGAVPSSDCSDVQVRLSKLVNGEGAIRDRFANEYPARSEDDEEFRVSFALVGGNVQDTCEQLSTPTPYDWPENVFPDQRCNTTQCCPYFGPAFAIPGSLPLGGCVYCNGACRSLSEADANANNHYQCSRRLVGDRFTEFFGSLGDSEFHLPERPADFDNSHVKNVENTLGVWGNGELEFGVRLSAGGAQCSNQRDQFQKLENIAIGIDWNGFLLYPPMLELQSPDLGKIKYDNGVMSMSKSGPLLFEGIDRGRFHTRPSGQVNSRTLEATLDWFGAEPYLDYFDIEKEIPFVILCVRFVVYHEGVKTMLIAHITYGRDNEVDDGFACEEVESVFDTSFQCLNNEEIVTFWNPVTCNANEYCPHLPYPPVKMSIKFECLDRCGRHATWRSALSSKDRWPSSDQIDKASVTNVDYKRCDNENNVHDTKANSVLPCGDYDCKLVQLEGDTSVQDCAYEIELNFQESKPEASVLLHPFALPGDTVRIESLPRFGKLYTRRRSSKRDTDETSTTYTPGTELSVSENDLPVDLNSVTAWYRPQGEPTRKTDELFITYGNERGAGGRSAPVRLVLRNRDTAPRFAYDNVDGNDSGGDNDPPLPLVLAMLLCPLLISSGCAYCVFYISLKNRRKRELSRGYVVSNQTGAQTHYDNNTLTGGGQGGVQLAIRPPNMSNANAHVETPNAVTANEESVSKFNKNFIIKRSDLEKGEKIGEGSYGWVYKGTWRDMVVAIKEVNLRDPDAANQLLIEASGMQDLRPHANIVTCYGVVTSPIAIVTEFCSNGSLDDMLYGKKPYAFTDDNIRKIILGAAKGISHLHAEGVIHRDLAARNILIDDSLTAKVADFGMARTNDVLAAGQESQTKTTVGPIKWMAPEQLEEQKYSMQSDVWSFAVIVVECLTRRLPWHTINNMKAAQKVLNGEHLQAPPSTKPEILVELVDECFSFKANERPKMTSIVKRLSKAIDANGALRTDASTTSSTSVRRRSRQISKGRSGSPVSTYAAPPRAGQLRSGDASDGGGSVQSSDFYGAPPSRPSASNAGDGDYYGALDLKAANLPNATLTSEEAYDSVAVPMQMATMASYDNVPPASGARPPIPQNASGIYDNVHDRMMTANEYDRSTSRSGDGGNGGGGGGNLYEDLALKATSSTLGSASGATASNVYDAARPSAVEASGDYGLSATLNGDKGDAGGIIGAYAPTNEYGAAPVASEAVSSTRSDGSSQSGLRRSSSSKRKTKK